MRLIVNDQDGRFRCRYAHRIDAAEVHVTLAGSIAGVARLDGFLARCTGVLVPRLPHSNISLVGERSAEGTPGYGSSTIGGSSRISVASDGGTGLGFLTALSFPLASARSASDST